MDNLLISALSAVDVRDLSYAEWMNVGMALKHEGYACSVWDEWSRNDQRYHPGECARKWNTFHGSGTPVTGATIVQMAKQRGWKGERYICVLAHCVWSPADYPAGWEKQA